jgi:diguanylate cyclase (GGDEF)-like protein
MNKKELLSRVRFFSHLSDTELDIVAGYCRFQTFRKGRTIFDQGAARRELFVIDSGEVHITQSDATGKTRDVAYFLPGETFGELDLLAGTARNTAALALDDTRVLIFPMKGVEFRDILEKHSEIFAGVLHQLLAVIASRIRSTNKLISENTPWIMGLRKQLLRDPLTGLYNKAYLEDEAELGNGPVSLVLLKPDNFKMVNDTCGHETGDQVLKAAAASLSELYPETVRYRGDEFAVLLHGVGSDQAADRAVLLKERLEKIDLRPLTGSMDHLVVSAGCSVYPDQARNREQLILLAVEHVMKARAAGGAVVTGSELESGGPQAHDTQ